jgi:hypothetical protein
VAVHRQVRTRQDTEHRNNQQTQEKTKLMFVVKLFLVERRAKRPLFAQKVQQLFLDSSLRDKFGAKSTCL